MLSLGCQLGSKVRMSVRQNSLSIPKLLQGICAQHTQIAIADSLRPGLQGEQGLFNQSVNNVGQSGRVFGSCRDDLFCSGEGEIARENSQFLKSVLFTRVQQVVTPLHGLTQCLVAPRGWVLPGGQQTRGNSQVFSDGSQP